MSCEMIARIGKVISTEKQELLITDTLIADTETIGILEYSGIVSANCCGKVEEAILTVESDTTADVGDYNVYLYNTDPTSYYTGNLLENDTIYGNLLGILKFTSFEVLTSTNKDIGYSRIVPDNMILKTALDRGLIYAVVTNASGGSINYFTNGNTIKLNLKIWRY